MTHPLRPDRSHDPHASHWPVVLGRRAVLVGALQALAWLAACAGRAPVATTVLEPTTTPDHGAAPTATPLPVTQNGGGACIAPAIVAPTPIPYPGYTQMEPSTGLHVTGEAREVDLASYRLAVTGLVDNPLSLTYDDLRCLPKIGAHVTLTCPGFFSDEADLAGVSFADLVALSRPQPKATRVNVISVEGYSSSFALDEARATENFLAYQWEGEPLPPSHGFPARAVVPARAGSNWVKWVTQIELS